MARTAFLPLASALILSILPLAGVYGEVPPAATLLPETTKGYISVPDVDLLREKWDETQLGQLTQDPVMKPFIEDMRKQIESRLGRTDARLSIQLEDLEGVYGGEVCLATIQPGGDAAKHALVLLVDVSDHHQEAAELLAQVERDLLEQEAKLTTETIGGVTLKHFVLPRERGETEIRHVTLFRHGDCLVAADDAVSAKDVLVRLTAVDKSTVEVQLDDEKSEDVATEDTSADDEKSEDVAAEDSSADDQKSLAQVPAFQGSMEQCQRVSEGLDAHVRWYIEPFGYVQALRASSGGRQRRGTDMLKVLANQGFTAIQGVGGMLTFSTEGLEVYHRTFVFAPKQGESETKYELAARMLEFPNVELLSPHAWVPNEVTNYLTFHWKMQDAFEYSKTLVDEVAGAPVFDDILDSLKRDPHGPQVDLRSGLVELLGERASFFTDFRVPVTPTSERWLLALAVTDPVTVAATLDQAMRADPDATKRVIGEHTVWEIIEAAEEDDFEELDIDTSGFGDFGMEEEEEEEEDKGPLLSNAAFTVAYDHLLVASHLDYMEDVLATGTRVTLIDTKDYTRVDNALTGIGAGDNSFRFFARTDKSFQPTYELLKQGKMPEAKTLFGNLLNRIMGPEEEGVLREQRIKGDKLPDFEEVRGYLGPAGSYVRSLDDGWLIEGCVLPKMDDGTEAAGPMVSRQIHDRR